MEIDYHEIELNTLYNRYASNPNRGLDPDQVEKNKERYGRNEVSFKSHAKVLEISY
jgi:hypothetical protein